MTSSAPTSAPQWMAGTTYDASGGNAMRQSGPSAFWYNQGVAGGGTIGTLAGVTGGAGLAVTAGSGMSVNVGPGSFVVPASAAPANGGYSSTLASQANLAVAAADPLNPRIDLVAAFVTDAGTSSSTGTIATITGTPATSPAPPAAPANSVTLAQVLVPAGSTSVTAGNITDKRTYTCAAGGVLVAPHGPVTGYRGQLAYDRGTGRFYHNVSGMSQPRILPWPPVQAVLQSNWPFYSVPPGSSIAPIPTALQILSCTFACDGRTDICVTTHICGIFQPAPFLEQLKFMVFLDGSLLDETDLMTHPGDLAGISHSGFTSQYSTGAASGDTPSAGKHTLQWMGYQSFAGFGSATFIRATPQRNAYLRVEPVVL